MTKLCIIARNKRGAGGSISGARSAKSIAGKMAQRICQHRIEHARARSGDVVICGRPAQPQSRAAPAQQTGQMAG